MGHGDHAADFQVGEDLRVPVSAADGFSEAAWPTLPSLQEEHAVGYAEDRRGAPRTALTPRQRQILHFVLQGMTNGEIAGHLGLSRRTVEVHRLNLMHRLNAHNIAQLFRQAMELGLAKDLDRAIGGTPRERKDPDRR